MQFKKLEPIQQNLPSRTHLFLVCLQERYAKAFLERGVIRFAEPKEWRDKGDTDGKRGDSFEGVYASMKGHNTECYNFLRSLRNNSHSFKKGDRIYFFSDDILQMRAYCMYGLHDKDVHMNEKRSPDHKFHKGGRIPLSYFNGLFDGWTKESYKSCTDGTRPVVLMITPDKFHALVVTRLRELGVRDDEIMNRPINYIDYKGDTFICVSDKDELFQKHIDFKEQSEVRIVVDTTRDEVKQVFAKDGLIELGPIDPKVAFKLNFYFDDLYIELNDNLMMYSLPEAIVIPMEGPEPSLIVLQQILSDERPESPMTMEKMEVEIDKIAERLEKDYSIQYDRATQAVFYQGKWQDIAKPAVEKMVAHYNNYLQEGSLKEAQETLDKIVHFFPMHFDCLVSENGIKFSELIKKASPSEDEKA